MKVEQLPCSCVSCGAYTSGIWTFAIDPKKFLSDDMPYVEYRADNYKCNICADCQKIYCKSHYTNMIQLREGIIWKRILRV